MRFDPELGFGEARNPPQVAQQRAPDLREDGEGDAELARGQGKEGSETTSEERAAAVGEDDGESGLGRGEGRTRLAVEDKA